MLNFKFKFIKLGGLFVLAFVLFFHNISLVHGQQAGIGSLRSLNIKDVKIETSDTEIKVSGKLINQSQNIATGKITHLLILETIDSLIKPKNEIDQMPPLIVSAEEGEDYFSLGPNKQKSFSYSLPTSQYIPKANYRLSLSFIRSDGKEEAYYNEIIKDFGSFGKEGFLAFDQQSCVLFGREGEKFGRNSGPAFLPGESPKISCLVKNIGDKEIEVYPNILWKEVFVYGKPLEGKIAEEKHKEKIIFKSGEAKTISLFMPAAKKPQTYQGFLSFEDENGNKRSFSEFFRWTIAGESARVKSVAQTSQLKDFYDKGDVVSLSVDYFGSSDLYWAGDQEVSNLSDLTMKAVIKDKKGNICGEKEETLPEITDGFSKNKIVDVVLIKKCEGMNYAISLSSGQKSLAEQSGDLPKFVNRQKTLQYFYFGVPAFILLLAFYLFIRKKSVPVYIFIFALAGVAMFSGLVLAETKIFPANGGGGTAYGIQWGGEWVNDGSAVLYSTAYGTGGLNKLRPDKVSAQLSGFFINNNDIGGVDIDYFTDDTSCKNTSMEVEYKVLMIADGLSETPLTIKHIVYNANTGYQHEYVSIPPTNIQSLYDNNGIPRKNPKLIIEMKQIGLYSKGGEEEFNYSYEYVGTDENYNYLGDSIYNYESGAYEYLGNGKGDYIRKEVANTNFYPGLFTSAVSERTTKADAYAKSDTIKIEVPLLLPTPTLRLKPLSETINPGQTKQFSVFYDADGPSSGFPEENVTAKIGARGIDNWSSDDTTVVKVNETGLATAVASGSAEIKAKYYRSIVAKAQISVPSLRIRPMKVEITVENGRQFKSVYDEDGWGLFFDEKEVTGQSVWISDNPDSATVENKKNILSGKGKGWVSALKKGSANISADYSGLRAVSYVLVKDIPIPLDVSCFVDKNPVLVNEQTATFTATAVGGTEPYSYTWTEDNVIFGTGETISKSYSSTGTKNMTIEAKDNVGAVATNSCSAEVNDGTIGECDTVKNQCLIGILDDIADSESQYLWNCVGTKSTESTDYCSLDKPTTDPSYNVSPDGASIEVYKTAQFEAEYNSDTGNSDGVVVVKNLAEWTSSNPIIASVTTTGNTGRGLATCLKPTEGNDVVITATYKNEKDIEFTDTAELKCTPTDAPPPKYTLTVNIIGKGEVFGLINCDQSTSPCKKEFSVGDFGSITALPDVGYSFSFDKGWTDNVNGLSKACSVPLNNIHTADIDTEDHSEGDNYCDLTMDSHKEVTVMFEKDPLAPSYRLEPISATAVAKETFQFDGYYDSDGTGPIKEVKIDNSKAVWSEEDNDDTKDVASISGTGLATCNLADAEGANIYSEYLGIKTSASLFCTDGIDGKCDLAEGPNECDDGVSKDIDDNSTHYLWNCVGTKSTAFCSLPKTKVTADISADLAFADIGDIATIQWKSKNATFCTPVSKTGDSGWTDTDRINYSSTGDPDAETYETGNLTTLPITFKITCTNGGTGVNDTATDEVTIGKKNPEPDPSYNVSPEGIEIQVKQSFQFSGIYDSDKTDTSNAIADVTKLAKWQTADTSVVTIVYEGADAGLATCEKAGKIAVKSTYINAENKTFTDEAELNCLPIDPPNYTLTVNIFGQGMADGLIGICKQAKCEKSLESGTSGYLRATPDNGYSFSLSKFSGDCSQTIGNVFISDGNDDYSEDDYICDPLVMTSNKEVTVMFEKNPLYEISPDVAKIEVGRTVHFSGLWSDGERYQQDKTNVAVWKAVDRDGDDDDSIATFESMWLEKGEAKCVSDGTAFVYSSYGGLNDKAELICDKIVVTDHTLTVAKTGDGYGEITGAVRCDIDCDLASKDYSEGSVVKITATPVKGSSFNGWSGACSGKDPVCELTMIEEKDASASFTEDTNPSPKAYISADNTSVDSDGFTKVIWKSDNAVKCIGEYGGSDADWIGERGIDGSRQTKSFQSEEERVYGVICYDKFDDYDSASVDISARGIDIPTPSVDLFADPDEVEMGGTSKLSWLSSNTKSCEIISDDDSKKSWNNLGSFGAIDTSVLNVAPKEYSYTISCEGDDDSFVEDEVVVKTKEKICENNCGTGKIDITSSTDTITAIIVAGLTAKSGKSEITVSSDHCKDSKADLSFDYKNGNGPGEAIIEKNSLQNSFPMTGVTLGYIGGFFIKNIKGKTDPGIYPIKITAECFDKDDNSKQLTGIKWINLKVKTIFSSDWLEF